MRVIYTYILVTVRPIQTTDLCFRAPLSFGLFLVNGRRAAGTDEIYPYEHFQTTQDHSLAAQH